MLIDTHAHLYWESYKSDLNEVLKRAKDAGVNAIMNIGVDIETSQKALEQTKNIKGLSVYSTIGIHPHEASTFNYKDIAKLEKIYLNNKSEIVAIGECGLDYFFESNPGFTPTNLSPVKLKQLQRQLFQAQIDLAKK
ncbi:MAG: TatD family hydrolase, partial [Patescibacteria group bacterium]